MGRLLTTQRFMRRQKNVNKRQKVVQKLRAKQVDRYQAEENRKRFSRIIYDGRGMEKTNCDAT